MTNRILSFTKMHGIGNDYVYVDCTKKELKDPAEISKIVSDRHFGIGSDGLILIGSSDRADFRMNIYKNILMKIYHFQLVSKQKHWKMQNEWRLHLLIQLHRKDLI